MIVFLSFVSVGVWTPWEWRSKMIFLVRMHSFKKTWSISVLHSLADPEKGRTIFKIKIIKYIISSVFNPMQVGTRLIDFQRADHYATDSTPSVKNSSVH